MIPAVTSATTLSPGLASRLVNLLLSIKPLALIAKNRARTMMIQRAESIGVPWMKTVEQLKARDWDEDLVAVQNSALSYPDYYVTSFHAYEEGNLGWEPALEVEVAAYAVHARIWPDGGAQGDARLRKSYHDVLKAALTASPATIVDLGCGVGMSTEALADTFPAAQVKGVDLSPYFLAVARYRSQTRQPVAVTTDPPAKAELPSRVTWLHAAAEATGLSDSSVDLVSACLLFHELPQSAAIAIIQESYRLLRSGGHLAIMDMNPRSEVYAKMPPYILTLLKSTEPYLDQYFGLDLEQTMTAVGFERPMITCNSPRHRTIIARKP